MRKNILLAISLFLAVTIHAQDISLNGKWSFLADSAEYSMGLPANASTVVVPHTYNIMPGLEDYTGIAWYERTLPIMEETKGRKLRLCFESVYHDATVYVNGRMVGEHIGKGYTPFSFDITDFVDAGKENKLVVKVDNSFTDYNFPYQRAFDWAADGGIYRNVNLHVSGRYSIRYAHFTPQLNPSDSTATSHVRIKLHEEKVKSAVFVIKLTNKRSGQIILESRQKLRLDANGTFNTDIDCGKVIPWHFDNPELYCFEVSVWEGKNVSDTKRGQIGFRKFEIEGNRFALNGEPVRLPGIETMPGSNPDFGMAETKDYIVSTVTMLKDLNTTITRFHWPQSETMFHAFDSLGILVQEELSWWQQPHGKLSPNQVELAKETLSELIEAHYNHPSIFSWGMSNEVRSNDEDVKILGEHIHQLDSSRMAVTVGNRIHRNLEKEPSLLLDIPTWNEYIGTWHSLRDKGREDLPECLQLIRPALNGRPLFITEGGLCEPAFVGGDRRRIDDMLYHIKEWGKTDYITGYIYFSLEDYRTQMGEEGVGRFRIRRHGITDCRHQPKPSYYVLRDLMCPVEVDKVQPATAVRDEKSLAGVWEAKADDRTLIVGIRVKNSIPAYTVRGYFIRYTDKNGEVLTVPMPVLKPDERCDLVLPDINDCFKFDVCRPDGMSCLNY